MKPANGDEWNDCVCGGETSSSRPVVDAKTGADGCEMGFCISRCRQIQFGAHFSLQHMISFIINNILQTN